VGLLADFFVATPEDALQYGTFVQNGEPIPADRIQVVSYKNFTPLALERLWAILRREEWDVKRHNLEYVFHSEDGESWLFRFPNEMVQRLSALKETDLHQVAGAWVNPPEVPGNSDELLPVLMDLKQLAARSQMHDRNVYLWGSL
jgi:hypothetical protein